MVESDKKIGKSIKTTPSTIEYQNQVIRMAFSNLTNQDLVNINEPTYYVKFVGFSSVFKCSI
ncbi:hypothetical protein T4D_733 [Trichinella pseudospiralis]|uniref:Uncharacterized protein n=1 Tax=Trichinella pseudospiralis TaxID=6337 RepID=A0A0V1FCU7_TRIPS|nr:hypothetical protein T4D_733 [Trichinella pseudospiralis]